MQLERIVVATDFSEPAGAAAEWVARHFAPAARLVLVYVIDASHRGGPSVDRTGTAVCIDDEYDVAARRLREAVAALGAARCAAEIRFGRPAEEIARAGEEFRADLIVVGKHAGRSGLFGGLGSTAEELVRRLDDLRLQIPATEIHWHTGFSRTPLQVPITFTARRR